MRATLVRLLHDTEGQNLAEYGIALAVIAAGAAASAVSISHDTDSLWTRALQALVLSMSGG